MNNIQAISRENSVARRLTDAKVRNWPVVRLAVYPFVFLFLISAQADAASTIYNMDRFLQEPHPFSNSARGQQPGPAPQAPAKSVSPGQGTPGSSPSSPDMDDLDLQPDEMAEENVNDPLEPVNRAFFEFNELLAKYLLGPVARGYNAILPLEARTAFKNFLDNLKEPVVLANDLLQAEWKRGFDVSMRLVINSTLGIVGFIDVADKFGFEKHNEDFGQTLAVWGIGEGFYLVLPVFGPSNPRDAIGKMVVDGYFDPLGYYLDNTDREYVSYALTGVNGIVTYASLVDQIDNLRDTSIDFYGAMRSLYRQRRQSEISNGRINGQMNINPGLDGDLDDPLK